MLLRRMGKMPMPRKATPAAAGHEKRRPLWRGMGLLEAVTNWN